MGRTGVFDKGNFAYDNTPVTWVYTDSTKRLRPISGLVIKMTGVFSQLETIL